MQKNWVLVRGIVSEEFHWWDFLPMLKSKYPEDVFSTADILGNGATRDQRTPFSLRKNIEFIRNQTKSANCKKKIVIGFSLAGGLAIEWAHLFPDEIEALVLINPSFTKTSILKRLRPQALFHILNAGRIKNPTLREEKILKLTTSLSEQKIKEIAPIWGKRGEEFPVSPLNFLIQLFVAAQFWPRQERLSIPVIILTSGQDQVVHPLCSRHLADHWNWPQEVHSTSGHDLTLEDPEWVIEKIQNFLKKQSL